MISNNIHDEWLSLVEVTGPFLAPPVLNEAFPQGLDLLDPGKRKRLRQTYEEWREALDSEDPEFLKLHQAWIKEVISNCLGFNEDGKGAHLKFGAEIPPALAVQIPEQGITLSPEYVLVDELQNNKPLLLVQSYVSGVDLQAVMSIDGWSVTPADRMVQQCRSTGCRLGLVTDGERWMLIDAPVGAVTTFASWYARLWIQEPITLQAFVHLMSIRRFFVAAGEQIPALIDKSLQHQDEVTTALGEQVQRAVEVLIQSLDRADQDRNRELLKDVTPAELYEAGLTVMMRLVFLLSAEERGLLLMGDECYEENYAISTLRMQLRSESEEILERRWDAWARLLSVFRAVYGGIDHENMRLPALGGSLFDPDRFSFLEGRAKGSNWHQESAKPLPIDNRTVLLLLEAIQQYQGRSLSYRALDVEQIGYVYEGLLERSVERVNEVTIELDGTKSAANPWVRLSELDALGNQEVIDLILERSGISKNRIINDFNKSLDDLILDRLLSACAGNYELRDRLSPYARLIKVDSWGYPLVYPKGAFAVTSGSGRRETGAHYTPKILTQAVVEDALIPSVYLGPSNGLEKSAWKLKSPLEILELKICDPAMGSGAFLVQVCRWLADRLFESWLEEEKLGRKIGYNGLIQNPQNEIEYISENIEERFITARRLVAERCLYGVDINPLAVELAKLSIWLITMSRGRPFGFLDHNLRCGDSLLGINSIDQLLNLDLLGNGKAQKRLFGDAIKGQVHEALETRKKMRKICINDISDVLLMSELNSSAKQNLSLPGLISDALLGEELVSKTATKLEMGIQALSEQSDACINGSTVALIDLRVKVKANLSSGMPVNKAPHRPFHWPIEFPEVFEGNDGGFDVVVGNPPFLWALRISIRISIPFSHYLKRRWPHAKKNADLCSYFFLRAYEITKKSGYIGFIATNSISEADTKETALDALINFGVRIYKAEANFPWPGSASVKVSTVFLAKNGWSGHFALNGKVVDQIPTTLDFSEQMPIANSLVENKGKCFKGSVPLGDGFFISAHEAANLIKHSDKYEDVLFQYINGEEFSETPSQSPKRWVIYFKDWSLQECEAFPLALDILYKKVKPERDKIVPTNNMAKQRRDLWWKFTGPTVALYKAIKNFNRVIAASAVSKHHAFSFLPANYVYSNALNVFAFNDYQNFSLMQSNIHNVWALANGSKLGDTPRYNVTDCFETFPFPSLLLDELGDIGEKYYKLRTQIMESSNFGLTKLYNEFHNPHNNDADISTLRSLQIQMDDLVAKSYGWNDLNLEQDFYEVPYCPQKDRIRFSISEKARAIVLRRLFDLNKSRFSDVQLTSSGPKLKNRASPKDLSSSNQSFDF
jgi:hypothetical protein